MLSFNLKTLLADSLILGNIISHKKISFDKDAEIQTLALEKSIQIFKNISTIGRDRESMSSFDSTANKLPIDIQNINGVIHSTIIKTPNNIESVYEETTTNN